MKVIPDYAPGWVGPLSRRLDAVFAEQAGMVDATDKPLPAVRVLLPGRAYDDLERSVGGFPAGIRVHFRGCPVLRRVDVLAPTVDCTGKE